ncbi:MAG TPA: hypothetical protein VFB45_06310 [Pseudolabrys sp.]|nr:hypothetical protein [Pseudolabrys sp.]
MLEAAYSPRGSAQHDKKSTQEARGEEKKKGQVRKGQAANPAEKQSPR